MAANSGPLPSPEAQSRAVAAGGSDRWYLALCLGIALIVGVLPGLHQPLCRDDGIYMYAGLMAAKGVPPYLSIFSHKGPLAQLIVSAGVLVSRLVHADPLASVRVLFLLLLLATVAATYVLARRLDLPPDASTLAALWLGAAPGLVIHALGGPRAKLPMVLFEVLTMVFAIRRSYFLAGLFGGAAGLVWQPGFWFPMAVLGAACLSEQPASRRRAVLATTAGVAVSLFLCVAYFAAHGALQAMWDGLVRFNLVFLDRLTDGGLVGRLRRIRSTVRDYYGGLVALWALIALIAYAAARCYNGRRGRRSGSLVLLTVAGPLGWSLVDFQSYPDFYPFTPLLALGVGILAGAVMSLAPPRLRIVTCAALMIAIVVPGALRSRHGLLADWTLADQRAFARQAAQLAGSPERLVSIGAPHIQTLIGWPNPTRYGFVHNGVDRYIDACEPGGFAGWVRRTFVDAPTRVVVLGRCRGRLLAPLYAALQEHYREVARLDGIRLLVRVPPPNRREQRLPSHTARP